MSASVLYDAPGPRARRRNRILSVLVGAVLLLLVVLAALQLQRKGQFAPELWSPLLWPADPQFPAVWRQLGTGVRYTLTAAALAIVLSLVIGTAVTTTRLMLGRVGRLPVVVLVELLRGSPVVVLIFFSGKILPVLGVDLSNLWYLVIGLTLYNSVVIAEILRAGVAALPRGQAEAGLAIGMTRRQTMLVVQMPQAFRLMLPALISQLVVIVKDTSLAGLILTGPDELLRISERVFRFLDNPLQTYTVIAAIYIVINLLLTRLATYTEKRLSTARGGAGTTDTGAAALAAEVAAARPAGEAGALGDGPRRAATGR